jgi:hypothetical protein
MEDVPQRGQFQQAGYYEKNADNGSWFHVPVHFSDYFD